MGPLLLVNWRTVNVVYCSLMWAIVVLLAMFMLAHGAHGAAAHHTVHYAPR